MGRSTGYSLLATRRELDLPLALRKCQSKNHKHSIPKRGGPICTCGLIWDQSFGSDSILMIYSLLLNGNIEPGSQIAMFVCKRFFHINENIKIYKANTISNHVHIVWRFNTPITLIQLQVQSLPPAGEIQATTKTQHYFQQYWTAFNCVTKPTTSGNWNTCCWV